MNKSEKIICLILGAVLAWYIWGEMGRAKERAAMAAEQAAIAATNQVEAVGTVSGDATAAPQESAAANGAAETAAPQELKVAAAQPSEPEKVVVLENDDVKLELSSWGAVVKAVTLKRYAKDRGAVSDENPPVRFDFASAPLGELTGLSGLAPNASYDIQEQASNAVTFVNGAAVRTVLLQDDYRIVFDETFGKGADGVSLAPGARTGLSLGAMRMGDSKNDLLSVDSAAVDAGKGKPGVIHHGDDDSPLKPYLVGGLAGGCSGSKDATGMAERSTVAYAGAQTWVAAKNRFFVTAFAGSSAANGGFEATVARDLSTAAYRPDSLSARVLFADVPATRRTTFYVGPKKQALLWDLGMKDVMEFGMWRWLCYPLVWVLNFFHGLVPNFGIAIILLTILVRLIFWPLTHKSTVGMKKMQEIQPLMKEIQAKYKDNPQRLQQETWQLYRDKKVNPMSSCLPMLIQIPVFIALFNVLRSAVELRYAPFLWIGDLSEPEALFASWFPFGGLNVLPVLMAATTALQSYFTPSAGDNQQQKMMMVFMPIMMLVMFYSFPSALSLYWFLSNLFSIVQMWLIRRQTAPKGNKTYAMPDQIIDPPQTRQQRRHS